MPSSKKTHRTKKGSLIRKNGFFERRPLVGYIVLTFGLMMTIFMVEKGTDFFRASLLDIPRFDGTALPIREVPDWLQTGGKNDRLFSSYSSSELIDLPRYNANKLEELCDRDDKAYVNACVTYSTVYMGSYHMDHTEYAGSHLAVDIRVPKGTPVYAVANGVVDKAVSKVTGFGRYIVIRHPDTPLAEGGKDTLYSGYAHLSEVGVKEGKVVKKGDLIGYSGDSGISTTPHLHFQIDRSSAPYHPWWPFSSAQASAASISFFEGINAGLGKAEAIKNTINPLVWTQEFLNHDGDELSEPNEAPPQDDSNDNQVDEDSDEPELDRIILKITPDKVEVGESVTILITVLDQNKRIFKGYQGKDIRLTVTDRDLEIPRIDFDQGKVQLDVEMKKPGNVGITVRDGDIADTGTIFVTGEEVIENNMPPVEVEIPETVEDANAVASVQIEQKEKFVTAGDNTMLLVSIFNQDGAEILQPDFEKALEVTVEGPGRVQPDDLKSRYFDNGVAKLEFYADQEPGTAKVFLNRFPDAAVTIEVLEGVKPVTSFGVLTDGKFAIGKKEEIIITTLNEAGRVTPVGFPGKAEVTIESGSGRLKQSTLKDEDFTDGEAKISLTPLGRDPIVIRIKSGVLVGTSDPMTFDENPEENDEVSANIFPDVPDNHPNATAILELQKKGILGGNPDGTFQPQGTINRAEFAKIILLALNVQPEDLGDQFSDVPDSAWFAPYAKTAAVKGLVKGYPDGSFGPAKTINRAELFTILMRAADAQIEAGVNFDDVPEDSWFALSAKFAYNNNLLEFGSKFEPSRPMTRAEVAEAISRFLHL